MLVPGCPKNGSRFLLLIEPRGALAGVHEVSRVRSVPVFHRCIQDRRSVVGLGHGNDQIGARCSCVNAKNGTGVQEDRAASIAEQSQPAPGVGRRAARAGPCDLVGSHGVQGNAKS